MILVTGASGFVGSHLVPKLVESGYKVRCLVRPWSWIGQLKKHMVELATGDVTDADSLKQAMKDVETVIHLVAIVRESRWATFSRINVQGTKNVVQAAAASGVKRFIHVGALGSSSENPRYDYLYSKWQGEEVVRSSGLDFTILKPSAMFGKGAGFIDALVRSLKMFPLLAPIAGPGETRLQPIWVEDVVSCILKTLKGEKREENYEIGGPEHLAYEQILDAVIDALGTKRIKIHIPLPLMRPAVMAMGKVLSNPPVTLGELAQLQVDNITDLDSLERQFGFKPLKLSRGLDYLKPSSS